MREDLSAAELLAIAARTVMARDLVWITAKDRDTGDPVTQGLWAGVGTVSVDVIDAITGSSSTRTFVGDGAIVSIGSIPLTADITIRTVEVVLSQIHATVQNLVRDSDPRNAPIQIYRGYYNPATRVLLSAPKARFVGNIDGTPIETPAENGNGSITLRCVSTTRELTRTSKEVRSHQSQLARDPADHFYTDTARAHLWDIRWGTVSGPHGDK